MYPWNKGLKIPFKARPKAKGRSIWNKGIKTGIVPKTVFKKGEPPHNKGKKAPWTSERNKDMNREKSGNKHWNWKGGVTPINHAIRNSFEYKLWRTAVFERDDYTCIECGEIGYVEADHIKPFAHYPELRFAIDNGRTLCKSCHKKIGWNKSKNK